MVFSIQTVHGKRLMSGVFGRKDHGHVGRLTLIVSPKETDYALPTAGRESKQAKVGLFLHD